MGREPHPVRKFAKAKCKKAKIDESLDPVLDDESIAVENLLAEPKSDHVSVDGVLCFGDENIAKCLEMEDFTRGFEYGFKTNFGGLGSYNTQGEDDLKLEVLDGLLDGVDEVDDIHAASDLASACEDFLLDIEFAGKVSGLECGPCNASQLGNSTSESHSPEFSGSSNGAAGASESSMATIRELESKNVTHQKAVFCDSHVTFTSEHWCQAPVEDKKCPTSHVQSLGELEDEKPLMSFILSRKNGKSSVQAIKHGTPSRHKRLRKPTRRFIEEFSDNKPRSLMEKQEISAPASKDRGLKVRSHNELHHTRALALNSGGDSFCGASSQTVTEYRARRGPGRPKKSAPVSWHESDDELSASESEDDRVKKKRSKKCIDRRKHQRMWTLAEVMKLVDGISQYGVSRWTDIKNHLFSSSAYRTPIDLRDKWRNLLRASCVVKQRNKEVEEKQKQATRPLPMSVLLRVRELADSNPYPQVRGSKRSHLDHEASPAVAATKKGTPFSPRGRNVRRKKYT